ncbi:hypothetical protein GCM10027449_29830 [Sinomonas notoginsengisoli]|uniref:helix-hairpin-helix domain-containing protein n=1 Tax=Sinomonas notoginsengisoli TaxID=1457311 RepID=UPI001F2C19A3|nr:hypothetical protein [Sinomonas notoginsengisoli]
MDINLSSDTHRVERIEGGPAAGRLGIRRPLKGACGLSRSELDRIIDGQPFASLDDARTRAEVKPRSLRRLAEIGAFDSLHRCADGGTQAHLVAHLAELAEVPSARGAGPIAGQLALDLGVVQSDAAPSPSHAGACSPVLPLSR